MELDENISLSIIKILAKVNAPYTSRVDYKKILDLLGGDEGLAIRYLNYLQGMGFIGEKSVEGNCQVNIACLKLTSAGENLLMTNGGLAARKNFVTVVFQDEVYQHLEDAIKNVGLTPQEERTFLARLKQLPASAIEHLALKLLDAGIAHSPEWFRLL